MEKFSKRNKTGTSFFGLSRHHCRFFFYATIEYVTIVTVVLATGFDLYPLRFSSK